MLFKVKVFPGAKKEAVIEKSKDSFEVKVKEKPVQGGANKAVLEALSSALNVSVGNIKIIKGFRKRNKIIKINGL